MSGIADKIAAVEPGHNNRNVNGSPDGTYLEYKFTQEVADIAEEMMNHIPGLKPLKLKELNDYPTSLQGKVSIANSAGSDVYISIHSNAAGSGWTTANGLTVYRYPGKDLRLAQIGLKHGMALLGLNSRGIKEANFLVLRESKMPSILFEFGFHDNRSDLAKLKTREFRVLCAIVVCKTVCEFLGVKYVEYKEDDEVAKYHIVKSGDRLGRIAIANNMTERELRDINTHLDKTWPDIYVEYPSDIVYLSKPSLIEVEHGKLRRELLLISKNSVPKVELDKLKSDLQKTQSDLTLSQSSLQKANSDITTLKGKITTARPHIANADKALL